MLFYEGGASGRKGSLRGGRLGGGIRILSVLSLMLAFGHGASWADEADAFFDDSYVHEIRITIDDANWYSTLYNSHAYDSEDPYFPASFSADGVTLDNVGVRFKGNSSFRINSIKKSIKIDFDEYDEDNDDLSFFGLKKLNLNNAYKDPSMMRAKLFFDFAGKFIPSIRSTYTRVYVNDELMGLYLAVEQVDKLFVQDRFGGEEDGNLYKGAASDDANGPQSDFGSDLAWEGSSESAYYDHYQLKTNETANDYSGLVSMLDALNNGNPDTFPQNLEPLLDVENALAGLALNSLFVNLDSYNGSAHNFYLYQSDSSGQFSHILWDANEAFGTFTMFGAGSPVTSTDLFWTPSESRPLMEDLWENDEYKRLYLALHARMLREGFSLEDMSARIDELADLIRADVYADPNKAYSDSNFETNLTSSVSGTYGLKDFVEARVNYLNSALDAYALQSDIRLNELLLSNVNGDPDESGDRDAWLEIYNGGVGETALSGLYLTDDTANKTKWALPSASLDDGEWSVFWLDGEQGEGDSHSSIVAKPEGGSLYLYDSSGTLVDSLMYSELDDDVSFQRQSDGADNWIVSDQSTQGTANTIGVTPSVQIYINEILAENDTNYQDPAGQGYPDWFELYNPNEYAVDLGGMYLTDNIDLPQHWKIPDGLEIAPLGHLLIWADNDEEQGDNHANFKLGSGGDEIVLFDKDYYGNVMIDRVEFGAQLPDISYGRDPDGGSSFATFTDPTPGFSNEGIVLLTEKGSFYVGKGYDLNLEVEVLGGISLTYQWLLNGEEVSGADSQSLTVLDLGADDAGDYSVRVSFGNTTVVGEIASVRVDALEPDGDADGDGIKNIVESAFGMDPDVPDSEKLPTFTIVSDAVNLRFDAARSDLEYLVESSVDLSSWEEVPLVAGDFGNWSMERSIQNGNTIFYRLKIDLAE